jgi:archaeoflavoprotein AfpA
VDPVLLRSEGTLNDQVKGREKVAWGITGSGDRLAETISVMKELKKEYGEVVDLRVYLSKAGKQVTKWYKLYEPLKQDFVRIFVETGPNAPFLAGELEMGKFSFLLIAPATSNTVAKLSIGICDTLLCNSAIMALKAFVPVYIMPSDLKEGSLITRLPNQRELRLRIRKEDADNAQKLGQMDGVFLLEGPENIRQVFKKHFGNPRHENHLPERQS